MFARDVAYNYPFPVEGIVNLVSYLCFGLNSNTISKRFKDGMDFIKCTSFEPPEGDIPAFLS